MEKKAERDDEQRSVSIFLLTTLNGQKYGKALPISVQYNFSVYEVHLVQCCGLHLTANLNVV